jgi:hypothetical protein
MRMLFDGPFYFTSSNYSIFDLATSSLSSSVGFSSGLSLGANCLLERFSCSFVMS